MIEIYQYPKVFGLKKSQYIEILQKAVEKKFKLENISVVFVSIEDIQKLNIEYRDVDSPTDVLSFNYNTPDLLGEVYVCIEYIQKNRPEFDLKEEVSRLIAHGILHLYGYDHKSEFIDVNQENLEDMFLLQEEILKDIMEKI
jgi:probable rRNA maturation factor